MMGEPSAGNRASGRQVKTAPTYDPAFRPAVAEGYLTVQQAVQRGSRRAFAARLMRRHRLNEHQALLVADNRVSLREVTRRVRPPAVETPNPRRRVPVAPSARVAAARASRLARRPAARGEPLKLVGLVLVLIALVVAGSVLRGRWAKQLEQDRRVVEGLAQTTAAEVAEAAPSETGGASAASVAPAAATDVQLDEVGRVTRVVGPDPRTVLQRYCMAVAGLEPIEVVGTRPPTTGVRLGLLRDLGGGYGELSITIRREFGSDRWSVGNGKDAIAPASSDRFPR